MGNTVHVLRQGGSNKPMVRKSFEYHDISSPVVHDITVRIVLTILLMSGWAAHIVDVNGALLLGEFRENEHIYMKVPKGFKRFLMSRCIVVLAQNTVWCKECCKGILAIIAWNNEFYGV